MDRACDQEGRNEECIHNFCGEAFTWKTEKKWIALRKEIDSEDGNGWNWLRLLYQQS